MASQTLVQAKLFINNEIVSGVVEDIISVNPIYNLIPFQGYSGQAILVNREVVLGDSQVLAVDTTITAKAAATFTQASYSATRLIGDVELDALLALQSSGAGVDQLAIEISSKAKSIARLFQTGLATGTGTSPQMNSLHSLCDSSQYTTATGGTTSQALSFALLDELLDLVKAKDGQVDWMMMAARTLRSYRVLLRALGGVTADEVITFPDGRQVMGYSGIPIFKNEYLSVAETSDGAALTGGAMASCWAGTFDDGSSRVGIAAIHPEAAPAGITVKVVGDMETKDSALVRVVQYSNMVSFNRRGLARLTSLSN
jgi:hypothetical protein